MLMGGKKVDKALVREGLLASKSTEAPEYKEAPFINKEYAREVMEASKTKCADYSDEAKEKMFQKFVQPARASRASAANEEEGEEAAEEEEQESETPPRAAPPTKKRDRPASPSAAQPDPRATLPPLEISGPAAEAADFVTGCVNLNRMHRGIERLDVRSKRALIYGGDLIVP